MTSHKNCAGVTRRDCLRLGLGSLLGGGLAHVLRLQAQASSTTPALPMQAKSCILIWMDGGPSHYETFDPKPLAPSEYRGQFQPIQTRTAGVQFSEHPPRLAACSHKLAVVR